MVVGVGEGDRSERSERILLEELPALAKEVARVETVRAYAGNVPTYLDLCSGFAVECLICNEVDESAKCAAF